MEILAVNYRTMTCRHRLLVVALLIGFAGPVMAQEKTARPAVVHERISITQPLTLIRLAGPIFWPLLACSLVAFTFSMERFIALRRNRVLAPSFERKFRRRFEAGELDRAAAIEMCRTNGSPLASLYLAAVRLWGRPTAELQKAVSDAGGIQILSLKRNLRVLQSVGNISLLIGLLGTVLGMIHSFNNIADLRGTQRGEELSRGIAEAMVATAFGLAVAIPSLAVYTFFAGRVERLICDLDDHAGDVIDLVSEESLKSRAAATSASRRLDPPPRLVSGER